MSTYKKHSGWPHFAQFWCNVSPFRINTCKSVSKQTTLTPFRMSTYEKQGGGGYPPCQAKLPSHKTDPVRACPGGGFSLSPGTGHTRRVTVLPLVYYSVDEAIVPEWCF